MNGKIIEIIKEHCQITELKNLKFYVTNDSELKLIEKKIINEFNK